MKKIALIDGDPMVYIIGYNLVKDQPLDPIAYIKEKYNSIISWIAMQTGSSHVRIAWSAHNTFRADVYQAAVYKGNRGTKPDFVAQTEPVLATDDKYVGYLVSGLEADDLLSIWAEQCREAGIDYVVASPDKDLDQIPGNRFKYDKDLQYVITPEQAQDHLNMQMLKGDSTDNILGIPGFGDVKAAKLLKEHAEMAPTAILNAYVKHFGPYYGPLVHQQTRMAVYMLTKHHPFYELCKSSVAAERFTETQILDLGVVEGINTWMLNPFQHAGA
jgi:hypothetical protein